MKTKAPFKVGDKVTTDYIKKESGIVRTIKTCVKDDKCRSGWRVSAVDVGVCPTRKQIIETTIRGVDSSWFVKIKPTTGGLAF